MSFIEKKKEMPIIVSDQGSLNCLDLGPFRSTVSGACMCGEREDAFLCTVPKAAHISEKYLGVYMGESPLAGKFPKAV
jgi:hypothetical protein